jgi:hypothetical protein
MSDMILKVNGTQVLLTEFPEEFIKNTLCGMIRTLKGVETINTVELRFSINE